MTQAIGLEVDPQHRQGWQHPRPGRTTRWETPLVNLAWGDWKAEARTRSWTSKEDDFVAMLMAEMRSQDVRAKRRRLSQATGDHADSDDDDDDPEHWSDGGCDNAAKAELSRGGASRQRRVATQHTSTPQGRTTQPSAG